MSGTYSRAFKWSVGAHVAIVLILVLVPWLLGWLDRRNKPEEEITFIELVQAVPPAPAPAPAPPAPTPPPEPAPEPPPEPDPIPEEPPKPKPKLKPAREIQVNTNRIVRRPPPQPAAPTLSPEEISRRLREGLPTTSAAVPATTGSPASTELSAYYGMVQRALYEAWTRPGGVAGLRATADVRISRDGSLIRRSISRSSGDTTLDDSVMDALNRVSRLSPLPSGYDDPFLDLTVHFESTGVSM